MRVFVTGACGFIGREVVQELLSHGHQVLGLARSDANAEALTKAGAEVHRGDLENHESLRNGAKATDGVIHLAYVHDFENIARTAGIDTQAIKAMGDAMAGTGKPLVIASGTLMAPKGVLATEDTEVERTSPFSMRALSADAVYALSKDKQVRGSVVRLSPTVHGAGDQGFMKMLSDASQKNGVATYVGDGSARWPAVHRMDAASLFRLALEKGAAGATYHAAAEQGVTAREFMSTIGKKLGVPVKGKSIDEAAGDIGFFAHVISLDNPTSSEETRKELGWRPTQLGLLADLEANY